MSTTMTTHGADSAIVRDRFDVERIRKDFPILAQKAHGKPLIYLDNAASSQKPQAVIDAGRSLRDDILFLTHGGPVLSPEDAAYVIERTDAVGFVGASSLERIAVEESLVSLTRQFKSISPKRGQ